MTEKKKERPIIFSGEMIKAILEGKKTQTRRVIKPQPGGHRDGCWPVDSNSPLAEFCFWHDLIEEKPDEQIFCPYGKPGDRLWVREAWADMVCVSSTERGKGKGESNPHYKASADSTELKILKSAWKPSIHMPKWASRITLEIKNVRVEKVQKIPVYDAYWEGAPACDIHGHDDCFYGIHGHQCSFERLWDSINAKRGYGWDKNPWVWVIEFKRSD